MRVAMYYNNKDIRIEEMPVPQIGPGELLVKIHSSGICGSDLMEWYRIDKAPMVLGHETAGEVVEVGAGVEKFKVGDRIVTTHHVPCFTCHHCITGHETTCDTLQSGTHFDPGGFCEYVRLPAINVDRGTWKMPDEVSYDEGTFVEPLACVLRGQRMAGLKPGNSVLVLGSGIAGLLHVHLAATSGAGLIVATDRGSQKLRLDTAVKLGANHALEAEDDVPARFREMNGGLGADLVIVSAMAATIVDQAIKSVERGGTILLFAPMTEGATIDLNVNELFWKRDITMTTTYAGDPTDCATALKLIAHKRLNVEQMITHTFGLADTVEGFRTVAEGNDSIKVIIRPQE